MSKINKTRFAENISKRRKALRMNQEALAERIGVHVNTIKNIERGLSEGQPDTRNAIAEALGVEVWELMGGSYNGATQTASSDRASLILEIQSLLTKLSDEDLEVVKMTAEGRLELSQREKLIKQAKD